MLCFMYFLSVIVWLTVPVQSIAWKDSSPKCVEWDVKRYTLTHSCCTECLQAAMMSMAYKEGLSFPPAALNKVIVSANQDIRQV